MKKRLFAGFAALCMAASLASAAFAETATPETARAEPPQAVQYDASEDAAGFAVSAAADPGVLPDGAQLAVSLLDDSAEDTPAPIPEYGERAAALDLTFYKEDAAVEPNGTVKVSIQLPQALAADLQAVESPTVVHRVQQDDGTTTPEVVAEADAFSADRTQVSFETDSFSVYEIYGVVTQGEQEEKNAIDTYAGAVVSRVEIADSVKTDGRLTLKAYDASNKEISVQDLKSAGYTISWQKGGAEVTRTEVTEGVYNMDADGAWVNVAYDNGAQASYTVTVTDSNGASVSSGSVKIDYYTSIQNGSFETPAAKNNGTYEPHVPSGTQGIVWKTTGTIDEKGTLDHIELISTDSKKRCENGSSLTHKDAAGRYHNMDHTNAANKNSGTQYAELNAESMGALYQDVLTTPGATMHWSVDHNGRRGTDTMAVVIMATKDAENITRQDQLEAVIQEIQNNPNKYPGASVTTDLKGYVDTWTTHTGDYIVPEGQYMTRYFFVAVDTAPDDQGKRDKTVGNHIDNVWFSTELPPPQAGMGRLTITKKVYGLDLDTVKQALTDEKFISYTVNGSTNNVSYANTDWTVARDEQGNQYITASYVVDNIELPSGQRKSYTIQENSDKAQVPGYTLTVTDSGQNVTLAKEDNDKSVTITNTYTPNTTTVTVSKTVTGTLGDKNKDFNFTLKVTDANGNAVNNIQSDKDSNEEISSGFRFTLKDGESITFYKIPVGATVTVTEDDYGTGKGGYTTSYKVDDAEASTQGNTAMVTAATNGNTIAFTNNKDVDPDTGITLHSMPYLMVLAGVLVGGTAWMRRRKRS